MIDNSYFLYGNYKIYKFFFVFTKIINIRFIESYNVFTRYHTTYS